MGRLPATIPRAGDDRSFFAEPLGFLEEARARAGDLFVLRDGAPLFSRSPDCAGVVVALGSERQQTILTDIASFGMPPSAAHHLKLPARLANLNRSLHSMRGQEHSSRKRMLSTILTPPRNGPSYAALRPTLKDAVSGWKSKRPFGLLSAMRSLAQRSSSHLLFAAHRKGDDELTARLTAYFHLRREASSPAASAQPGDMAKLLAAGNALDRSLRAYVRSCRRLPAKHDEGIFATLARAEVAAGEPMSEDEVIAHINVLHISSTEPVAVSLAWIVLILTQLPGLQELLRRQIREDPGAPDEGVPAFDRNRLLDRVINESLRLFPPNAFMVRTTMRPTSLNGVDLPKGCEVVLCPLLAHRDPAKFPDPGAFLPSRWQRATPSPFDYFPFGGGGHACIGRAFALPLIKLVLSFLLERFELTLDGDQAIDWRLHIMLMPRSDPLVLAQSPKTTGGRPGTLAGPVAGLLDLTEAKLDSTCP
ncbi:MAG TPA: cytochrome P450 [Reyranella sp.]|nr:cytochrome P450 [Reyranella sp.]